MTGVYLAGSKQKFVHMFSDLVMPHLEIIRKTGSQNAMDTRCY